MTEDEVIDEKSFVIENIPTEVIPGSPPVILENVFTDAPLMESLPQELQASSPVVIRKETSED
jgi:hypothetical protein